MAILDLRPRVNITPGPRTSLEKLAYFFFAIEIFMQVFFPEIIFKNGFVAVLKIS